jgi:hypothetical protein
MKNPFSKPVKFLNRDLEIKFIAGNHMQYQYKASNIDQLLAGIKKRHSLTSGPKHFGDTEPHDISAWLNDDYNKQFPHDFQYIANSHGFRCDHTGEPVDIMAFGCSVTYGVGVSQQHRWSNQLADLTGCTVANYGIPGLGNQEIGRMFAQITRFTQPRVAVFLLPEHTRTMLTAVNQAGIIYFNAFDNYQYSWPRSQWPKQYQACETYYNLPMTHHVDHFIMTVHDICTIAEARGIQVIFSSWASTGNQLLQQQDLNMYSIPCNTLPPPPRDYKGRDQSHPGIMYHQQLATSIANAIVK